MTKNDFCFPCWLDFRCSYTNTAGELEVFLETFFVNTPQDLHDTCSYVRKKIADDYGGTELNEVQYRKHYQGTLI